MFAAILGFVAYSLIVFLTDNLWVLVGFTAFNAVLIIVFKIGFNRFVKNLISSIWFVAIVFLFNLIFDSVVASLIVAWKILIVTNGAFIFSCVVSPTQLASGFSQLLSPLRIFKVNTNDIVLMLVIAFNFIPIIKNDTATLKQTLKSRGIKLNLKTFFTQSHLLFIMFFANIFKRVEELDLVLAARNYK